MVESSSMYFQGLSANAGQDYIVAWTAEIEKAELHRLKKPSVMDIYGIRLNRTVNATVPIQQCDDIVSPVDAWISQALLVEEAQSVHFIPDTRPF